MIYGFQFWTLNYAIDVLKGASFRVAHFYTCEDGTGFVAGASLTSAWKLIVKLIRRNFDRVLR